ncbi:ABC-2 type transport system permease protein [Natronobacillus azotifigens]|uniref:Uncharacterized protein n=1 Tax=Natronobacillus azotifigens TaxID=472978 RepID=A0A9J6RCC6_9BACI|nr:hypothetical protein [Natronobacillus azotifigens]MCZ0702956.1 hypothetical protein [Natronobacillus azotifigens]
MRKIITLTQVQVKDFLNKYIEHVNVKNRWLGLLSLFIPALFILPAYQLVNSIYEGFNQIGFPELTITYMYIGTVVLMFFACIPMIISVFFYAKDLQFLTTLPVKVEGIIFSKLATVYLYLFVLGCFFFGTSVIVYSTIGEWDLYSLIAGIIALLISPLLPMILTTLIIIPFMALVGKGRKRNLMVVVGNVIFLFVFLFLQLIIARAEMDIESFYHILLQEDGLLRQLGRNFPPSIWLTRMIQGSLLDGGLFVLLNLVFLYALKLVSQLLYTKALLAFNQQGGGEDIHRKGTVSFRKRRIGSQLITRHIQIILSNPIFLINTVLIMFLPILIFMIMLFTGEASREFFHSSELSPYILYIYIGIITAPAMIGNLSATSITREGKAFWETRILPISARENLKYRIYATLLITFIATVLLAIAGGIYLQVSLDIVIRAVIFSVVATLFLSTIDIVINIERPTLNWTSPTAAVKNNLNVIISLFIRVGLGGGGYYIYQLFPHLTANEWVTIATLFFLVLYGISHYIVFGIYTKKFDRIDV